MIRTWNSLLAAVAVCALFAAETPAQEIVSDQAGVARVRSDALNDTQSADWLYGAQESVWLEDFQPPPGVGVDPVTIPRDNSVGYAVTSSVDDILYRINRTNRHYYGLDDGFTSAQAFIPLRTMNGGTTILAVNPRAFVSDDGRGGVNVGLTARRYFEQTDRVIQASIWGDYDQDHRGGYGQIGLYGAVIGRFLSAYAFANIPVGDSNEFFNTSLTSSFVGDRLVLDRRGIVESSYGHYQFELAAPIPYFSRFGFEYGIGVYGLVSATDGVEDGFGISNRVEAQVTEDLSVNTLVTSDGVFGSNLSINLELTLPNGMPSRILRRLPVQSHLTRSDNRSYRVLTNTVPFRRIAAAINPKDGQAFRVAQINPDGAGGGPGMFGSVLQFEGLDDAEQADFDIIFVRPRGDGTDTNLNTTITLFDCQQLLGDGVNHIVDTTHGPVFLPVDLNSPVPQLTNSGAPGTDVVRLADENVVAGFMIDASGGTGDPLDPNAANAITGLFGANPNEVGADAGVRDFDIHDNTIQNAVNGIVIDVDQRVLGTDMTGIVRDNIIGNTAADGLFVSYEGLGAPSDTLNLFITDNQIGSVGEDAIDLDFSGSALVLLDISRNLLGPIAGAGGGNIFLTGHDIDFHQGQNGYDFVILDFLRDAGFANEILPANYDIAILGSNAGFWEFSDGTQAPAQFASVNFFDTNNLIATPALWDQVFTNDAVVILSHTSCGGCDLDDAGVTEIVSMAPRFETFINGGGDVWANAGANNPNYYDFLPPGALATGMPIAGVSGFQPTAAGAAIGITDIAGMSMVNGFPTHNAFPTFDPAFTLFEERVADDAGNPIVPPENVSIGIRGAMIIGGGFGQQASAQDGVAISLADTAVILPGSMIVENQMQNTGRHGLAINGPGMAMATLTVSDNVITGSGGHGMLFVTTDMETMTIDGDRNTVTNSDLDGLHMETFDTSTMSVTFRNSIFDDNMGRGVKGASFDSSSLTFSLTSPFEPLIDEDLNGNGMLDPGEDVNMNGILDDIRSSASNNGGPGIDFAATDLSMQSILIDDVLVDPNSDAGILVSVSGDVGMMGAVTDVIVTNSDIINTVDGPDPDLDGEGVFFRTSGFGTLTGLVMDNVIDGNAGAGFRAEADENSLLDLNTSAADMAAGITHGVIMNEITNNGGPGVRVEREASATIIADFFDNLVDNNGGGGMTFQSFGATNYTPLAPAADVTLNIFRNDVTANTGGSGMFFETNGSSVMLATVVNNLIDGNEVHGVHVTTNEGSFFGLPDPAGTGIGLPSVFDSNQVTNNGDAGFFLQNGAVTAANQLANLVVDITSDFAVGDPDIDVTRIAGNVDGIRVDHNGQFSIGPDALTSIRVGNAFNPFPDVIIEENSDDAVDIDIVGAGGFFNFNISNALLRGARALGALTDPGIEIEHDSSFTLANIVVGADISDSPLRGPVRDPFTGPRAGVVITDFADDGINVVYSNSDSTGSTLNLRILDSLIGQSVFGFNAGDGLDILVDNAGSPTGGTGLDVIIDNTDIVGNGGDGIRLRTVADTGGLFSDGIDGLDGQIIAVPPGSQTDSDMPPNGVGDTVFDGTINGDNTSDVFVNSFPFVLDPIGENNGWADLTSPDDFIADLQIINGSRIDSNGLAGLNLEIGTATRQRVSLQNSSFSGNGTFEIDIETFASFEPDDDDLDQGEGMTDFVGLDPTAKLDIYFGTLTFGPGPEPGPTPLPGSFAAPVGGEGPNTGSSNRFSLDYVSTNAEGFQTASTFKGAPRPANLFVRALVPDDDFPVDDMDALGPTPNMFLDFGQPFDEILWFTNSLPPTDFPFISGRWLDLNTP